MVNALRPATEPRFFRTFADWLLAVTPAHGDKKRLADAIGASSQDVNGWIKLGKRPEPERLEAIARHFRVRYIDLMVFFDPRVRDSDATYSNGSSAEPGGVHSVPIKGQLSPVYGGIWMNTKTPDELVGRRVLWNKSAPELYAYQVIGDELHPRVQAGEFIVIDPREAEKAGEEVLVELVDGRRAVFLFVARRDGMISFRQLGHDPRPVTLPESDVSAMHYIAAIVKSGEWISESKIGSKADV